MHPMNLIPDVIADTFPRLSRLDDTSALVGKKANTEDSELASYSQPFGYREYQRKNRLKIRHFNHQ
jgi:hypothetical protein